MTYRRVIPRDLFNEANLLKCLGFLWLHLDNVPTGSHDAELSEPEPGEAFLVEQDPSDGSISVSNVLLRVSGHRCRLYRPLNSREPWPLWCEPPFGPEDFEVFTDHGDLSTSFLDFIRKS